MKQKETLLIEVMSASADIMSFILATVGDGEKPEEVKDLLSYCATLGRATMRALEETLTTEQINDYLNQMLDDKIARFARFTDASEYNEKDMATIQ